MFSHAHSSSRMIFSVLMLCRSFFVKPSFSLKCTGWQVGIFTHGVHATTGAHGTHGPHGTHGTHGAHGVHGTHGTHAGTESADAPSPT